MRIGTTNQIVVTLVTVTTTSLPDGTVGVAYSATLAASGGIAPYTWTGSGLPAGLSLSTAGVLSGTPTTAATSTVQVTATDSHSTSSPAASFPLTISAAQTGTITVTPTLPDAYAGHMYAATLSAAAGFTGRTTWVTSSVPAWMTTDANGNLWGTPPGVGTATLQAQATDSASNISSVVTVTVNIRAALPVWFGAQIPNLPARFTTTCSPPTPANTNRGSYYTPGVGGDSGLNLQGALNAAASATGSLGDVIVLQAGGGANTYTTASSFSLPVRAGSGWIYVISSHAPEIGGTGLPAAGTRIGRADIPNMASITSSATTSTSVVITRPMATPGVSYYRLVGLDVELQPASTAGYVISTGSSSETAVNQLAQHITIDRCYIAGSSVNGATRGLEFDGAYMEITECRIERCWAYSNGDAGALFFGNSTGPIKVHNNWMTGGGEVTISGGFDSKLPAPIVVADIEYTNNHYFKHFTQGHANFTSGSTTMEVTDLNGELIPVLTVWDTAGVVPSATFPGTRIVSQIDGTVGGVGHYQMDTAATNNASGDAFTALNWFSKNMVESKVGQRILVDSNFFENAFGGGQARSACVTTAINQSGGCPWNIVEDMTVTNNVFTNCYNGGMQWKIGDGTTSNYPAQPGFRYLLRNNIFILSRPVTTGSDIQTSLCIVTSNAGGAGNNGYGGDWICDHNTFVFPVTNGCHSLLMLGTTKPAYLNLSNFVWSNNIFDWSQYGITVGGVSGGNWASNVPPQISQVVFTNNATINYNDATFPAGNFQPATMSAVGFTSYGSTTVATGYALTTASAYHAKGVSGAGVAYNGTGTADGTDLGCDFTKLPTS